MKEIFSELVGEVRDLDADRGRLRSFAFVVGGALLGLATLVAWRRGWAVEGLPAGLAIAAFLLALAGIAVPTRLKPLYRLWMGVAVFLGYLMTRVLLTLVFFLVVTPIGLALRLLGKDPLDRSPDVKATSFWKIREEPPGPPERLEEYY